MNKKKNRIRFEVLDDNKVVIGRMKQYENIIEMAHKYCDVRTSELLCMLDALSDESPHLPTSEMTRSFKVVSKCDPRDTFDAERGKDIARIKMGVKYHKAAEMKCKALAKLFKLAADDMEFLAELNGTEADKQLADWRKTLE